MATEVAGEPEFVTSADGTAIAVWRTGAGPPLVLVHGTVADHGRWAPVLPAFGARFTVLAMDRRGRGRSGDADEYRLEREYDDVVAVVESAGADVRLLGHSHGGVCAVEAALRTDRVSKLVLYEPPMGFVAAPAHVVQRLQALLDEGRRDELVSVFMQEIAGLTLEQIELLRSLPAWHARVAAAGTVPREERANRGYVFEPSRFHELDVPTLLVQGGDSPEAFARAGAAVQEALPDCRVVVLHGQRHVAMDTAAELFTSEVLTFLEA